jgi:hypothetical protein
MNHVKSLVFIFIYPIISFYVLISFIVSELLTNANIVDSLSFSSAFLFFIFLNNNNNLLKQVSIFVVPISSWSHMCLSY